MRRWYVLYTQPHKERVVQGLLEGHSLQVYLPTVQPARSRRSRAGHVEPLFARYLFVSLDPQTTPLSAMNWIHGVTRVVSFGGEPAVVPDAVIRYLQQRLELERTRDRPWQAQHRLRITAGPLAGLEGVFDRCLSAEGRARVFVQLLGQWTLCTVDIDCLEPL